MPASAHGLKGGWVDTGITGSTNVTGNFSVLQTASASSWGEFNDMWVFDRTFATGGGPCGPGQASGQYRLDLQTGLDSGDLPSGGPIRINQENFT